MASLVACTLDAMKVDLRLDGLPSPSPVRGERVRHPSGVEFEVLEADKRRIKNLRIHLPPASNAAKPEDTES